MKQTTFVFPLLIFLFTSCKKNTVDSCYNTQAPPRAKATMCNPNVMTYHFGLEGLCISDRVNILKNLGLNGIICSITKDNISELDEYYNTNEVKNDSFHIYDIYTTVDTDGDAQSMALQYTIVEAIYKKIQCKETVLQVIFNGNSSAEKIVNTISKCADIAALYNKDLIIYPHLGSNIPTAEVALAYINTIKKSNLYLAVHLCHELIAGNGNRIEEVVNNVAPYIKSASIGGASLSERTTDLSNWSWVIKPLYMGSYDLSTFYTALYEVGYDGPVAIHTFAVNNNFNLKTEEHLPLSINKITELANIACH